MILLRRVRLPSGAFGQDNAPDHGMKEVDARTHLHGKHRSVR
nr:MAG TPA: hypothetical protein [Caudoviricetes sp.]